MPDAGWYEDPAGQSTPRRWWDGQKWTSHTMPPTYPAPTPTYPPPEPLYQATAPTIELRQDTPNQPEAQRGLAWVAVVLVIVVVSLLVLRSHQMHGTASREHKAATTSDSQFYSDFNKLDKGLDALGNDAGAAAGSGNYAAIYGDQASLRTDVRVLRNDPVPAVITQKHDAGVLTSFEKGVVRSVDELANGLKSGDLSQIGGGTAGLQTVDNQSLQLYVAVGINHFAQ